MQGPRQLLFFHLLVLLHRSNRYSNSCWSHRMFEISSHKVSSILSPSKAKIYAKSSWSILDDTVTERADITGFGSSVGNNATPYYRLLGSLRIIEIFKKLAVENRGEILLIMIQPIWKIGSLSYGHLENCFFLRLVVLLHRRHFFAHC